MRVVFGLDAKQRQATGKDAAVVWDSSTALNGHMLLVGMSGAGKTHMLRGTIGQMQATATRPPRVHVMDVHGDIEIAGSSSVMFSEQTPYGFNPLRVDPDPHSGGVRRRIESFIATMNRVMQKLGSKQEAALRNILLDVYARHGFKADDPSTWSLDDQGADLVSDGTDGRLYLDVPFAEKDDAKALGAKWTRDPSIPYWSVAPQEYTGAITRWAPATLSRKHPAIIDVLRYARHILLQAFLGTGIDAVTRLEIANKAARSLHRKRMEALRKGEKAFEDEKLQADLDKATDRAIETFTEYAKAIFTGDELSDTIKYDSTDVLRSVIDRLENLNASGVFKPDPPPFDPAIPIWRYDLRHLRMEERKLFVQFRLEQLFRAAVQRGEQDDICEVVVLDEASNYVDDDPENIINKVSNEARKFGLALICASQSPTHFPEAFIASVATKVILGIDEMYWRASAQKMRVLEAQLEWIRQRYSMAVQIKTKGESKNEWIGTIIQQPRLVTTSS